MKPLYLSSACITEDDKHVILQPSIRSADASCMAMLLLDMRKEVDFKNLEFIDSAETMAYKVRINYKTGNLKNLSKCFKGPTIVTVFQSSIAGHTFILDAISENNEATIRDPFHGWMITIKSDAFNNLINSGGTFFQID